MSRRMPVLVALLGSAAWATIAPAAWAQDPGAVREPGRTHWFADRTVFTERSELSTAAEITERLGGPPLSLPKVPVEADYNLSKESFELFVPAAYDGKKPYGLFVWISNDSSGQPPAEWLPSMAAKKVLAIGADKAGNERTSWARLALALDAVHNVEKKYSIDPHRVYIGGAAGGGRCASQLGVAFPDVFEGGFYMVGCTFYRIMTDRKGVPWATGYAKPKPRLFTFAQQRSRHVLLTGDADTNREQTKVYFDGFVEDGFKHVNYLEVPNFGHEMPDRHWFEKGLALLEPVEDETAKVSAAKAQEAAKKAANAEADRLLSGAKLYLNNHRYDGARTRLKKLIDTYPDTRAAAEAKELMKEIEGKQDEGKPIEKK